MGYINIPLDVARFLNTANAVCFTGSKITGGATPKSDLDIVVLVDRYDTTGVELLRMGFEYDGYYAAIANDPFTSYHRGLADDGNCINIILVNHEQYFYAWQDATQEAIKQKAITRQERVDIFQALWDERGLID